VRAPKIGQEVEWEGHVWVVWSQADERGTWWLFRTLGNGNTEYQRAKPKDMKSHHSQPGGYKV
jgi:hypothetical protein